MKHILTIQEFLNESKEEKLLEGRTDAIYQFAKEIYDAGSEAGKHAFGTWWKDNQVRMTAEFKKI
jgi:hypothetical protein